MNDSNLVRKFKIAILLNSVDGLKEKEKNLFNFLSEWFKDLVLFETESHKKKKFYMSKDGLLVLERNGKDENNFMVRYPALYKVLVTEYSLRQSLANSILKLKTYDYFKSIGEPIKDLKASMMIHGVKTIEKKFKLKQ